jgi:hypothetical protein
MHVHIVFDSFYCEHTHIGLDDVFSIPVIMSYVSTIDTLQLLLFLLGTNIKWI